MTPQELSVIQHLKEECDIGGYGAEYDDIILLILKIKFDPTIEPPPYKLIELLTKIKEEKQKIRKVKT